MIGFEGSKVKEVVALGFEVLVENDICVVGLGLYLVSLTGSELGMTGLRLFGCCTTSCQRERLAIGLFLGPRDRISSTIVVVRSVFVSNHLCA